MSTTKHDNYKATLAKKASVGRARLLADLRSYAVDSDVKRAALGAGQEAGFEQSFASLAYSFVQEKAPVLLDYMVGFQLVDRNEDMTKAVGIFGFKLGDQWAYAPVFFLNGNMKGNELLYLKNIDSFVPLKENWINYLLAKRPHILGESSPDSMESMGILEPDIQGLSTPPADGKFASWVPPNLVGWAKSAMVHMAQWATRSPSKMAKYAGLDERLDFRNFISKDIRLVKMAVDVCQKHPTIKEAIDDLYGKSMIRDVLLGMKEAALRDGENVLVAATKKAAERSSILGKTAAADEPKKVEIITDQVITDNLPEMNDSEREKLLRDGYLIRDHRDGEEVSVAYNTQVEMALVNPDATDVYEVLTKPGTFEKCLIIHHPHHAKGRDKFVTVVRLDGDKNWMNVHQTKVFVKQQARGKSDIEEWGSWFKDQSDSKSLSKGGTYTIVAQNGQGTCAFEVRENLGDDCYRVSWETYGDTSSEFDRSYSHYGMGIDCCNSSDNPDVIYFNERKGTGFKSINNALYVPPDAKVIKIKDPPSCEKCNKDEESCTCDYFHRNYDKKPEPIKPGNLADLQLQIMQKTSELKLWCDHNEVVINRKRMSKMAGLFHLVKDHGLREKQAKRLIKEAERFNGGRYRIKYANPYAAMEGPGMGSFPAPEMSGGAAYGAPEMMGPQIDFQQIAGLSAGNTDPGVYDPMAVQDPMAMQVAQEGQQQGQKEIFDTAMMSSMLKAVREDSLVDRYLGDLVKALDRLGRILFMFYWHNEEFMNRYGKQDLPELEDTLRNAFEVLGDLVLFLKQKTIDAGMSMGAGISG